MDICTQVAPFYLKKGVPTEIHKYSKKLYWDSQFLWRDRKRKIKLINDSNRRIIVVLDENDNHELYQVFKLKNNIKEQENGRKANILCNKLVKSLDDGEYTNKALMDEILTRGVSKLRNSASHEFNLPLLKSDENTFEQINVQSLDLNNAYARCLWNNGLISWEMYDMLISASKEIRLRVLGMLAKQQDIITIAKNGNKRFSYSYKTKYYSLFRFAEVKVASDMQYMKQILTEKYFIFYWVDGVYYKSDTPKKIKDELMRFLDGGILKNSSYDYKFEKVPYLKYYKEAKRRYMALTKENRHGEPEPKLYSLSRAWLKEEAVEVL
jgi:hypothetical protein